MKIKGMNKIYVGIILSLQTLSFALCTILYPYTWIKLPRRLQLVISCFGVSIGLALIGPS